VALTEVGDRPMQTAMPLFEEREAAEGSRAATRTPRGHLRISSPVAFGQERIAPAIPRFRRRHPEVAVARDLSNGVVDRIHERVAEGAPGPWPAPGLRGDARPCGPVRRPRSAPEAPRDLARHGHVTHASGRRGLFTRLERDGDGFAVSSPAAFLVGSVNASKNVLLAGQAIDLRPDCIAPPLIRQGEVTQSARHPQRRGTDLRRLRPQVPHPREDAGDHPVATFGAEDGA
jgi:DNA-binding transcriptional LysR family regulator